MVDGKEITEKLTYATMLPAIQSRRLASCGNYDAIFAKVVNFSWSFKDNGTYDITINLISLGDIIESLKANTLLGLQTLYTPSELQQQAEDSKPTLQKIDEALYSTPVVGDLLLGLDSTLTDITGIEDVQVVIDDISASVVEAATDIKDYTSQKIDESAAALNEAVEAADDLVDDFLELF